MLKLGLKKKKKGKKKKDQELFTEEELEQYKREHQHHPPAETSASVSEAAAAVDSEEQPQSDVLVGHEKDEEWSKFALLTTGVDSILKKTQGDLNRIKSTSFFKRSAPPVPQQPKLPEPELEEEKPETPEEERKVKQLLGAVVELPDSDEESDHDDLAFAASYELPSAYVADLDDDEDQGPDPFDTGYADRVIKGPEVSARGKKIINIGSAVGVLTGKVDTAAATSIARPRRARRGIQNFLLESFEVPEDEKSEVKSPQDQSEESAAALKTLLDEPAELDVEAPIDLSVSLHLQLKRKEGDENEEEPEIGDDILKIVDLKVRATTPKLAVEDEDSADWAEFEIKKEESSDKPARPLVSPRKVKLAPASNLAILLGEDESPEDFEDPFDTTYVEAIIPKPIDYDDDFDPRAAAEEAERLAAEEAERVAKEAAEAKAREEEEAAARAAAEAEANRLSDDEFDPRADEEVDIFDTSKAGNVLKVFEPRDLLGSSPTNLKSTAPTLAPTGEIVEEEEEIDPFDTSAVDAIVPSSTELKYLEKELLDEDDDFDFDPRAGEEKPSVEDLRRRKSSLSLQLSTQSPKIGVSFAIPTPDLLRVDAETGGKIQKPLTPYYNPSSSALDEEAVDEDPFDTSYVNVAPTTLELDILEKEILKQPEQSLSDDDFDPRAITPEPPRKTEDLLNASDSHDKKVLTPARGGSLSREAADPFDTSAARTVELRQLEDELIDKRPEPPAPTDILSDTQDNSIYDKILTPQPTSVDIEEEDDVDPFDTSFVPTLQPGETEIKLIESELIN